MSLLSNDGRQLNEIHATMLETHWLMSHRAWLLVLLVRHFDEWGGLSALSLCVLFEWLDTKSRTLPLWRASLILRMFPTSKTRQIRSALSLNASLNISHTSVLWGNTVAPFSSKCSSTHSVSMIFSSHHPSSYFQLLVDVFFKSILLLFILLSVGNSFTNWLVLLIVKMTLQIDI